MNLFKFILIKRSHNQKQILWTNQSELYLHKLIEDSKMCVIIVTIYHVTEHRRDLFMFDMANSKQCQISLTSHQIFQNVTASTLYSTVQDTYIYKPTTSIFICYVVIAIAPISVASHKSNNNVCPMAQGVYKFNNTQTMMNQGEKCESNLKKWDRFTWANFRFFTFLIIY